MRSCLVRRCWLEASHHTHSARPRLQIRTRILLYGVHARPLSFASPKARTPKARDATARTSTGPDAWIALLDRKLPSWFRENDDQIKQPDEENTDDIADIVLAAQRRSESGDGVDLLFHLGVKQNRWRAVVWLVKHMVETIALPRAHHSGTIPSTLGLWTCQDSLYDITYRRGALQLFSLSPPKMASLSQSLDELTADQRPDETARDAALRHEILGSIWRSLGLMSIASADDEMRPEVLEIIAYLHHMEIMPASIYNQRQSADDTAIRQPPMLRLFSSNILTSLSDAAWRAHERDLAEDVGAKSSHNLTSQVDIPGAAVRMNSPGLRTEVWVELILWSCLHGGWILEGAATLRALYLEPKHPQWRPLSWDSVFRTQKDEDWDKLSHLFNSRNTKRRERSQDPSTSARKTVSSEVVTAYVDALLTTVRLGVGKRGAASRTVLGYISTLQNFLHRASLGLQNGSWNAVILRYLDSQDSVIDQGKNFETLMNLSPGLGEDLNATNHDKLPQYVLDGSAAVLGFFHRALKSRIVRGDIQGALRLFECLQALADRNKHRSLVDFFEKSKLLMGSGSQGDSEMFTNNFPGIEYPGFKVEIPPTVLGPFLELITDAKAYDWGRWLLYNDDGFDEPVLPECHYDHPAVAPALVRFAAETGDSALLDKAINARATTMASDEDTLPGHVLQSFVESQINLGNWRAAERVLQHGNGLQPHSLNTVTVAHLIRSMLLRVRRHEAASESSAILAGAKDLLSNLVRGKYDGSRETSQAAQDRVTLLLALLSTVSKEWADFCHEIRPLSGVYSFTVTLKEFNLMLDGIVHAYGSVAGQRLLDTCWPSAVRNERKFEEQASLKDPEAWVLDRFEPKILQGAGRKRSIINIPGKPDADVVIYGALRPNVRTMRIILRQAIEERKHGQEIEGALQSLQDKSKNKSASETIVWAADTLRSLREVDAVESAKDEVRNNLSTFELDELLQRLLDIPETTGHQQLDDEGLSGTQYSPSN